MCEREWKVVQELSRLYRLLHRLLSLIEQFEGGVRGEAAGGGDKQVAFVKRGVVGLQKEKVSFRRCGSEQVCGCWYRSIVSKSKW